MIEADERLVGDEVWDLSPTDHEGLMVALTGCMFLAPVVLLLLLDWLSSRVVADRPLKVGSKVPSVGKWKAASPRGAASPAGTAPRSGAAIGVTDAEA